MSPLKEDTADNNNGVENQQTQQQQKVIGGEAPLMVCNFGISSSNRIFFSSPRLVAIEQLIGDSISSCLQ